MVNGKGYERTRNDKCFTRLQDDDSDFLYSYASGFDLYGSIPKGDRSTKCDVFNVFSLLFGYDLIVTLLF